MFWSEYRAAERPPTRSVLSQTAISSGAIPFREDRSSASFATRPAMGTAAYPPPSAPLLWNHRYTSPTGTNRKWGASWAYAEAHIPVQTIVLLCYFGSPSLATLHLCNGRPENNVLNAPIFCTRAGCFAVLPDIGHTRTDSAVGPNHLCLAYMRCVRRLRAPLGMAACAMYRTKGEHR